MNDQVMFLGEKLTRRQATKALRSVIERDLSSDSEHDAGFELRSSWRPTSLGRAYFHHKKSPLTRKQWHWASE
jgi:hypothetical protein